MPSKSIVAADIVSLYAAVSAMLAPLDEGEGPFELLAHVEFQVRTGALLTAAMNASARTRLPNPGSLDTWAGFIENNPPPCEECKTKFDTLRLSASTLVTTSLSIGTVRNTVFHGGPTPPDLDTATLGRVIKKNAEILADVMRHHHAASLRPYFLEIDGLPYSLNSFDGSAATYWPRAGQVVHVSDASVLAELSQLVEADTDRLLASYMTDIDRDLRGFAERGSVRVMIAEPGVIAAHWDRRGSDRAETRVDRFSLTNSGERRWDSGHAVVSYTEFLKSISNWTLLKSRLLADLDDYREREVQIGQELFGGMGSISVDIGVRVHVGLSAADRMEAASTDISDEIRRVVRSTDIYRAATNLIALSGEAGSGKTHALLAATRNSLLEPSELADDPLLIFVTSSGKSAGSVRDLIDARVAQTRILDGSSVLALCRSGLAVLVVDGLDELLGFRTYDDPLSGLRPVLEELRGRGTILVSGRSSYFEARLLSSVTVQSQMPWPPMVSVLDLVGWEGSQLTAVLASASIRLETVPREIASLLRTPFFCLAYISWQRSPGRPGTFLEYLATRYLQRETGKIQAESGAEVFSVETLTGVFCELAAMSSGTGWSEISEEDLHLAAEIALDRELTAIERRRLVALCGVSAEWAEQDLSFSFTHSALGEYFLALQITQLSLPAATSLLTKVDLSPLAAGLVDVLGSSNGGNSAAALLQSLLDRTASDSSQRSITLGSLWQTVFANANADRSGWGFRCHELGLRGSGTVRLVGCSIALLTVHDSVQVELIRCEIGTLDMSNSSTSAVVGPVWEQALEMLTRSELATGAAQIKKLLRVAQDGDAVESEQREQDEFFASSLELRRIPVVMSEKDWSTDDDRVAWTRHFGADAWARFVNSLVANRRATLEPISASGRAKVRLRLTEAFSEWRASVAR